MIVPQRNGFTRSKWILPMDTVEVFPNTCHPLGKYIVFRTSNNPHAPWCWYWDSYSSTMVRIWDSYITIVVYTCIYSNHRIALAHIVLDHDIPLYIAIEYDTTIPRVVMEATLSPHHPATRCLKRRHASSHNISLAWQESRHGH